MTEHVEGTLLLDGLVEGRLPGELEFQDKLREWVSFAAKLGPSFSLDLSGDTFSLLPDESPLLASRLGALPDEGLRQLLTNLTQAFPEGFPPGLTSTLRSSEFRPGEEVQTVFRFRPDGTVETHQRSVEAKTIAPREPMSRQRLAITILSVALVSLALLGVFSIFFDVAEVTRSLVSAVSPLDPALVEVDAGEFSDLVIVEEPRSGSHPQELVLVLRRGDGYPVDLKSYEKALQDSGTLGKRLAVEALARGYVRLEMFDGEGAFVGFSEQRVRLLSRNERVELRVLLPRAPKVAKIQLTD